MFFNILCISSSVSRSSPPLVTDSVASPIGNDNDGIPGDELKLTAKPSLPLTHPKHNLFLFVCCKAHSPFRPVNMSAFMPHALHICIYGHRHPNLRKALGHIVTVHGQPLVFPLGFYLVTSELGILRLGLFRRSSFFTLFAVRRCTIALDSGLWNALARHLPVHSSRLSSLHLPFFISAMICSRSLYFLVLFFLVIFLSPLCSTTFPVAHLPGSCTWACP